MGKQKIHKKARVQPRPKKKKIKVEARQSIGMSAMDRLRGASKFVKELLKKKEEVQMLIQENIEKVITYFQTYDTIQLLGGVSLYLLNNVPSLEKEFESKILGQEVQLNEDAEVTAEYALSFGTAYNHLRMPSPPKEVINDLRTRLGQLSKYIMFLDMPEDNDPLKVVHWMIHMQCIQVRGDGYQRHVEEIFKELFAPHSTFLQSHYNFSLDALFKFLTTVELRVFSKLGGGKIQQATGNYAIVERWKDWETSNNKTLENLDDFSNLDFSNGPMTEFYKANPDLYEDGYLKNYSYDDYQHSDTIFWIYPINDEDKRVLEALSSAFGSNADFIAPGEYKGNIMNGHRIYEKPIIKSEGDRYFCFSPLMLHRNMFVITENLLKADEAYYNRRYMRNAYPECRDNYIEQKVKSLFEKMLPNAKFYSSVHYTADGVKTEMDVLGVSAKATYLIEVKAHELTHRDTVGIKGTIDKFNASVGEGCYQSNRAAKYVEETISPVFTQTSNTIQIDVTNPIFKIVITFQHYSTILGMMDGYRSPG